MARLSPAEINDALRPWLEELRIKRSCESALADLEEQEARLQKEISTTDSLRQKEEADYEQLQQSNLVSFWARWRGDYEEILAKEKSEWEAVRAERQKLAGQLDELQARIRFLKARLQMLQPIEKTVEELLSLREQILRENGEFTEFKELEKRLIYLRKQRKRLSHILDHSRKLRRMIPLMITMIKAHQRKPACSEQEIVQLWAWLRAPEARLYKLLHELERSLSALPLVQGIDFAIFRDFYSRLEQSGRIPDPAVAEGFHQEISRLHEIVEKAENERKKQIRAAEDRLEEILLGV